MEENISSSKILKLIGVQPPYFALSDLKFDESNNVLSAHVPAEQFSEMECGRITAAESGRHLAILGCCLLALQLKEEGKFYYLASSATYRSHLSEKSIKSFKSKQLIGSVSGNITKKREAIAKAELKTIDGDVLCTLDLSYHIFPEKIFYRFFSKHKHELIECEEGFSPYRNIPKFTSFQISEDNKTLTTTLSELTPRNCLGHFPMYSAVPIAILSHYLISASGYLLKSIARNDSLKYYVKRVELSAPTLCFVKEGLSLEVNFITKENKSYVFKTKANTEFGKDVGEMTITLVILK